jgi:hypothetical protein
MVRNSTNWFRSYYWDNEWNKESKQAKWGRIYFEAPCDVKLLCSLCRDTCSHGNMNPWFGHELFQQKKKKKKIQTIARKFLEFYSQIFCLTFKKHTTLSNTVHPFEGT